MPSNGPLWRLTSLIGIIILYWIRTLNYCKGIGTERTHSFWERVSLILLWFNPISRLNYTSKSSLPTCISVVQGLITVKYLRSGIDNRKSNLTSHNSIYLNKKEKRKKVKNHEQDIERILNAMIIAQMENGLWKWRGKEIRIWLNLSRIPSGMIWYGMLWYSMLRSGTVCCCMMWCLIRYLEGLWTQKNKKREVEQVMIDRRPLSHLLLNQSIYDDWGWHDRILGRFLSACG